MYNLPSSHVNHRSVIPNKLRLYIFKIKQYSCRKKILESNDIQFKSTLKERKYCSDVQVEWLIMRGSLALVSKYRFSARHPPQCCPAVPLECAQGMNYEEGKNIDHFL